MDNLLLAVDFESCVFGDGKPEVESGSHDNKQGEAEDHAYKNQSRLLISITQVQS